MAKEVNIDLSTPAKELCFLVALLSETLNSSLSNNPQEARLVFLILEDLSDEQIKEIIEPCIGAFVKNITINEKN